MTEITKLEIDTSQTAGMAELVQYGIEMPDGQQKWIANVNGDVIQIPGTSKAVSLTGKQRSNWIGSWENGLDDWAQGLRAAGVEVDEDTVFPKRIKRSVTVIVHETYPIPASH